jgi:hypothetical protein
MNFRSLVNEVINECNLAGGSMSVMGPAVGNTATPFSGDNYAPGDARTPKNLYGGVITRKGLIKKKKKKK